VTGCRAVSRCYPMLPTHNHDAEKPMGWSMTVTGLVFLAELVGGFWTHSLALLSDAAHVFLDLFALVLSYTALRLVRRPADEQHTYGFHRAESLAALLNGLSLFAVSGFIFYEALLRLRRPEPVKSLEMLAIAAVGLVANLVVAGLLHRHQHGNLNVRSAFLHVLADSLSSAAVIVGGLLMWLTGQYLIDPVLSLGISLLLFVGTARVIREAVHILVEGTPRGLDLQHVTARLEACSGVQDIHDLHVWTLGADFVALSAHAVLTDDEADLQPRALNALRKCLTDEFGIDHVTIQCEGQGCGQGCSTGSEQQQARGS